jgi:hypothetical protein
MKFVLIFILVASLAFQGVYGSEYVPILNSDQTNAIPNFGLAISSELIDSDGNGILDNPIARLWRCEHWSDYWTPILVMPSNNDASLEDVLDKASQEGLIDNWELYSWEIGKVRYGWNWADIIDYLRDENGDGKIDYEDINGDGIPDTTLAKYKLIDLKDYYLVLLNPDKL